DLPEDRRRGDEHSGDEPDLHLHPERLGRRREHQRVVELGHRLRQPVDDVLAERQRDHRADEERREGADDPDAELAEVLQERHLAVVDDPRHAPPYQPVTKCRSAPTPRPAWHPSRIAAVTSAFPSLIASRSAWPRASHAALAAESVQPAPWARAPP